MKKTVVKIYLYITGLLALAIQTPLAKAAIWTDFGEANSLGDYITLVWLWLRAALGFGAVLMIIVAGYMYMTSQGNPEQINRAKDILIGVIAGVVLLFTIQVLLKNVIGVI